MYFSLFVSSSLRCLLIMSGCSMLCTLCWIYGYWAVQNVLFCVIRIDASDATIELLNWLAFTISLVKFTFYEIYFRMDNFKNGNFSEKITVWCFDFMFLIFITELRATLVFKENKIRYDYFKLRMNAITDSYDSRSLINWLRWRKKKTFIYI